MNQPMLETERLILSKFEENDLEDILKYASNPKVAKMCLWKPHKDINDSRSYLKWINDKYSTEEGKVHFVWSIRLKSDQKAIGSIDFKQPDIHIGQYDYALSEEFWNKGIITEAAKKIMDWSLSSYPKIKRFQAFCITENIGSRRVMEKCGMELEGILRKREYVDSVYYDMATYSKILD